MRAAFGLLTIVVVMAIVLSLAKRQMSTAGLSAAPPAAEASATATPRPQAVGQQVQGTLDHAAAQRASETQP